MPCQLPSTATTRGVNRDPYLDSLRGIFHIILLVDHLTIVLPSMFAAILAFYEYCGYVSVAEGFVFLSGYVSGLVYTRIMRERGRWALWSKSCARARNIYLCYLMAVIALLVTVKVGGPSQIEWGAWRLPFSVPLPEAAFKVATLQCHPMFLEILPMYSAFLLFTPIIIQQLEKGNFILVTSLSMVLWIAAQYNARDTLLSLLPIYGAVEPGYFNPLGWQILFVLGLVCGNKSFNSKGSWMPKSWIIVLAALFIGSILFFVRHSIYSKLVDEALVNRSSLGPLRLLNFLAVLVLVCRSRPLLEKYIRWRGFAFLSKHSLQVFAFHLFPIYLVALVLGAKSSIPILTLLLIIAFCSFGLFAIAYLAEVSKSFRMCHIGARCRDIGRVAP